MRTSSSRFQRVALLWLAAAMLGCGAAYEHPHTTDVAKTMQRANFDPSRCHEEGPSIYWCDNTQVNNSIPAHDEQNNDARVISVPGLCRPGERFDPNKGCIDIDTGQPVPR